jgi:hypothetical protein
VIVVAPQRPDSLRGFRGVEMKPMERNPCAVNIMSRTPCRRRPIRRRHAALPRFEPRQQVGAREHPMVLNSPTAAAWFGYARCT